MEILDFQAWWNAFGMYGSLVPSTSRTQESSPTVLAVYFKYRECIQSIQFCSCGCLYTNRQLIEIAGINSKRASRGCCKQLQGNIVQCNRCGGAITFYTRKSRRSFHFVDSGTAYTITGVAAELAFLKSHVELQASLAQQEPLLGS